MAISARSAATVPKTRLIVAAIGGFLLAALVASGRISHDQLLAYGCLVMSVLLAGLITTWVTHRQVAPAERHLVPTTASRIDLLGTIIIPALLILGGVGLFGWLRPITAPQGMRPGRNALVLRSLVTPAFHVVVMVMCVTVSRASSNSSPSWLDHGFFLLGYANLWLLVVSLIPVPPLAGSVVLERLLPVTWWARYARIRPFLLRGALGIVAASLLLHLGIETAVQRLLSSWWWSLTGV